MSLLCKFLSGVTEIVSLVLPLTRYPFMTCRTRYQASGECPPAFSPAGPDYQRYRFLTIFPAVVREGEVRLPFTMSAVVFWDTVERDTGYG